MANTTISKHARQAARKAAAAAAEEQAKRQRANVDDLATYFSAHERAAGVDDWLAGRQAILEEQARQRRSGFIRDGGLALRAMRDRGESLRAIAAMTGLTEKGVRDAIRAAEGIGASSDGQSSSGGGNVAVPEGQTADIEAASSGPPAERLKETAAGAAAAWASGLTTSAAPAAS